MLLKEQTVGSSTPATAIKMKKSRNYNKYITIFFLHKMKGTLCYLCATFKSGNFLSVLSVKQIKH